MFYAHVCNIEFTTIGLLGNAQRATRAILFNSYELNQWKQNNCVATVQIKNMCAQSATEMNLKICYY